MIPAAARERQAAALGQSLRQAAALIQLPEASALRAALPAAAWAAIARAARRSWAWARSRGAPPRRSRTLTLADLRRFLECPLQGSVRVLLPMRDDDDAEDEAEAALRERENLGDARVADAPVLRDAVRARARRRRRPTTPRWPSATTPRSRACGSTARCPPACSARSMRARHLDAAALVARRSAHGAATASLPTGAGADLVRRRARAPARRPDRARRSRWRSRSRTGRAIALHGQTRAARARRRRARRR